MRNPLSVSWLIECWADLALINNKSTRLSCGTTRPTRGSVATKCHRICASILDSAPFCNSLRPASVNTSVLAMIVMYAKNCINAIFCIGRILPGRHSNPACFSNAFSAAPPPSNPALFSQAAISLTFSPASRRPTISSWFSSKIGVFFLGSPQKTENKAR